MAFGLTPGALFSLNPFSLMGALNPFSVLRRAAQDAGTTEAAIWMPAIEVSEQDGALVVRAELAGLTPDDVVVEITPDVVAIQGERRVEREEDQGGIRRTERQYGRFYRAIPLPEGAKIDQANASFDNGVLTIQVPLSEKENSTRQIPIETRSQAQSSGSQSSSSSQQPDSAH